MRALDGLARANGRAVASRCDPEQTEAVANRMPTDFRVDVYPDAHAVVAIWERHERAELRSTGGRVGVIAAGASDARTAAEAALIATEMGCIVRRIDDVGVAGLHRLIEPLEALMTEGIDVLIVAAGMDGALPSVVAGLVDVPVIGLPTAIGYGLGGGGEAALLAMLQSCAPGLVVVNIDNGVGAGAAAARIANRAAAARRGMTDDPAGEADGYRSMPAKSDDTTSAGERERSTTWSIKGDRPES
jgi:NCAIR mutase (PurE)-related protein